jgi:hypothetical protein
MRGGGGAAGSLRRALEGSILTRSGKGEARGQRGERFSGQGASRWWDHESHRWDQLKVCDVTAAPRGVSQQGFPLVHHPYEASLPTSNEKNPPRFLKNCRGRKNLRAGAAFPSNLPPHSRAGSLGRHFGPKTDVTGSKPLVSR